MERGVSSSALRFKSRLNKDTRDARGQIARGSRWYRGKKSSLGNKGEEFLNVKYITRVLIYQQAKSRCVIDNFIEDRNKVFFFLFQLIFQRYQTRESVKNIGLETYLLNYKRLKFVMGEGRNKVQQQKQNGPGELRLFIA